MATQPRPGRRPSAPGLHRGRSLRGPALTRSAAPFAGSELDNTIRLAVGVPALAAVTVAFVDAVKRDLARANAAVQSRSIVSATSQAVEPLPYLDAPIGLKDPARSELIWEFLTPGEEILDIPLDYGGSLQVTAHYASESEQEWPPDNAPEGSKQQWRALRFTPAEGETNLVQSVTKVVLAPEGSGWEPRAQLRAEALPLHYTKTFATVVLSTLAVMGAPVLPEEAAKAKEPVRFLCIGLGGGSVPAFLARAVPSAEIDVVELEPAVVRAATEAMGFVPSKTLRVHTADGVEFALKAAESSGPAGAYDAVLVDAYDAAGVVPAALQSRDGGLAVALSQGLLKPAGLVATNFLPVSDLTEPLAAYRSALAERMGADPGLGFSVTAEGTGNRIAVQPTLNLAEGPNKFIGLTADLRAAAKKVQEAARAPFDMASLAARALRAWPEKEKLKREEQD